MSIRDDLKAFVDGELSAERVREIEAALASDPGLKQEVEFMRALGFEIKKLAAEPSVAGRQRAIEAVKRKPLAWWHPYGIGGRLVLAGGMAVILAAIFFPVFAQSKASAKRTSAIAMMKRQQLQDEMARADNMPSYGDAGAAATPQVNGRPNATFGQGYAPGSDSSGFGAGEAETTKGAVGMGGGLYSNGVENAPTEHQDSKERMSRGMDGDSATLPQAQTPDAYAFRSMPETTTNTGTVGKAAKAKTRTKGPVNDRDSLKPNAGKGETPTRQTQPSNRMVIQNADMAVRVDDVADAVKKARTLASTLGGFSDTRTEGADYGRPVGFVTLRVPSNRFDDAIDALSSYGEVVGKAPNISSTDVTTQYADLTGRLRVLHAEEDSYVTMLRGAKKIGEILEIKDRLSTTRQEIQSLEEQRIAVKDQAMLSTIVARFEQKPKAGEEASQPSDWSGETWANAVNGLKAAGRFVGQFLIFLFVYAPIWIPPVALFWWLGKKAKLSR